MPNINTIRRAFAAGDFAFCVCAVMLSGTGCVTRSVIYDLGTTNTEFTDHIYMMSPDRDAIIVRSP